MLESQTQSENYFNKMGTIHLEIPNWAGCLTPGCREGNPEIKPPDLDRERPNPEVVRRGEMMQEASFRDGMT